MGQGELINAEAVFQERQNENQEDREKLEEFRDMTPAALRALKTLALRGCMYGKYSEKDLPLINRAIGEKENEMD